MCSAERMLKYASLTPEAPLYLEERPPPIWPQYGIVTFEGVSLSYEEDGKQALRNLWCCIRAYEKVRSSGRTIKRELKHLVEVRPTRPVLMAFEIMDYFKCIISE